MTLSEFGGAVRIARHSQGLTQSELALAAGLSRATINALESGKIEELGFTRVNALGALLGIDMAGAPASAPATPTASARLKQLQQRYIWWTLPGIEPAPLRVIAQIMDIGTLSDLKALEVEVGRVTLRAALSAAEPGWFSPQSWSFWHIVLDLATFDTIPPVPRRAHDLYTELQDTTGEPTGGVAAPWAG